MFWDRVVWDLNWGLKIEEFWGDLGEK